MIILISPVTITASMMSHSLTRNQPLLIPCACDRGKVSICHPQSGMLSSVRNIEKPYLCPIYWPRVQQMVRQGMQALPRMLMHGRQRANSALELCALAKLSFWQ